MIVGIVAAKGTSKRFPGKNLYEVDGAPMFWHSVTPLLASDTVDKVYVTTNSPEIKHFCEENDVDVIWRGPNASRDEDKLITILRYGYYSISEDPDAIVTIMANCPGHTADGVDKVVDLLIDHKLNEVRTFNEDGQESGLMAFSKKILQSNQDISYYIGATLEDVKEIHYLEDLHG